MGHTAQHVFITEFKSTSVTGHLLFPQVLPEQAQLMWGTEKDPVHFENIFSLENRNYKGQVESASHAASRGEHSLFYSPLGWYFPGDIMSHGLLRVD